MAKIIALTNQKGGVGKTTTTVNLGACLAVAGKKVLLVDLDPQGNASVALGLDPESFEGKSVYQVLVDNMSIKKTLCATEIDTLFVCPADKDLVGAEIELVGAMSRETRLKKALDSLREDFDYILIDCPPSLGLLTLNGLTASDSYLVPMQTEYFAMEGLSQLINTVHLIKGQLNERLELEGVLLTMFDGRNNLHKQVLQEINEHFKEKVFKSIIPRNVKLSECPSFGKPVILYDVDSKGAESYFALAKEVLVRNFS